MARERPVCTGLSRRSDAAARRGSRERCLSSDEKPWGGKEKNKNKGVSFSKRSGCAPPEHTGEKGAAVRSMQGSTPGRSGSGKQGSPVPVGFLGMLG